MRETSARATLSKIRARTWANSRIQWRDNKLEGQGCLAGMRKGKKGSEEGVLEVSPGPLDGKDAWKTTALGAQGEERVLPLGSLFRAIDFHPPPGIAAYYHLTPHDREREEKRGDEGGNEENGKQWKDEKNGREDSPWPTNGFFTLSSPLTYQTSRVRSDQRPFSFSSFSLFTPSRNWRFNNARVPLCSVIIPRSSSPISRQFRAVKAARGASNKWFSSRKSGVFTLRQKRNFPSGKFYYDRPIGGHRYFRKARLVLSPPRGEGWLWHFASFRDSFHFHVSLQLAPNFFLSLDEVRGGTPGFIPFGPTFSSFWITFESNLALPRGVIYHAGFVRILANYPNFWCEVYSGTIS